MNNEICVPAGALNVPGDDGTGAGVSPGVGDEVEFTVKGSVTRAGPDGSVYVTPTKVNGEAVPAMNGEEGEPDGDESGDMDQYMAKARAGSSGEDMP